MSHRQLIAVGTGAAFTAALIFHSVVAVPGNPIDDISVMKRVSFVMKDGVIYKLNSTPIDTGI